jgi:DNA-binding SARP family transcriptional activator
MPGQPTAEGAVALATTYTGRFALDFAYEDWAAPYRDSLHSGYLRVMEHAVRLDLDSGHFERGIFLAERAAEVDPDSDEIHLALTRLYRHSGAHAAAAEQYGHYARAMRDLGLEPLPLSDI